MTKKMLPKRDASTLRTYSNLEPRTIKKNKITKRNHEGQMLIFLLFFI